MRIEDAINHFLDAASSEGANEDSIYESLEAAGIPGDQADRLYKFTQIAWGRVVLDGMGITFPEEYYCFDANGSVVESGLLNDVPYFKAASASAYQHKGSKGFEYIVLTSAEFNTVNQALLAGSKPKNLVMIPPLLFMEPLTEAGMIKAQDFQTNHVNSLKVPVNKKPKWKFWG
ncbi:MAG: hypothetical protein HN350_20330 [Phycisphaerales bacterium]|jgi:hypothetical protein|nr:hypothetical protein [Phycisphaerales bacterium]